ncbi:MAG TPA: SAM-dependent methyltransferase [Drouetiella sp.]
MSEFHLRLEQAKDIEFWRKLNPELHITDDDKSFSVQPYEIAEDVLNDARETLLYDGYFQVQQLVEPALAAKLAKCIETIFNAGWPTPFAIVYDEYWEMFYRLKPLFEKILGPGYKQLTSTWCWYIETDDDSKGWGQHRDRPGFKVLNEDGTPNTLNVWVALTNATPDNGCIYILPGSRDENYEPGDTLSRDVRDLQNIRALPANAGDVLAWTESLLHWGSRSSKRAKNPRVSLSFSFQRSDKHPYETPLYEPSRHQVFSDRLGMIASNIWNYRTHDKFSPETLFACRQLAQFVPTMSFQNGHEREILEVDKRLSESVLWEMQEQYFEQKSDEAWERAPSRITSRMPFVESHFELIKSFLIDTATTLDLDSPLYILEIGGGSGCFAYRFLNQFLESRDDFDILKKLKLKYVLSEFSNGTVRNYLANKNFTAHKDAGILDFATFRPDTDDEIRLAISTDSINKNNLKNPLIVIANHVFGTIKQDAFRLDHGVLKETKFTAFREEGRASLKERAKIEEIELTERFYDAADNYYDDPALNTILAHYKKNLEQASVIFPTGALNVLRNLTKISNGNMAILAADKGFASLQSHRIQGFHAHELSRHGSFSCDVNFDAVERYVRSQGGQTFIESGDNADHAVMFAYTHLNELQHTGHCWKQQFEKKRAFDTGNQVEELVSTNLKIEENEEVHSAAKKFLAVVRHFNFEPHIFVQAFNTLLEPKRDDLSSLEKDIVNDLMNCASKVEKNVFIINNDFDVYDVMLRTHYALAQFAECLELSERIIKEYGEVRTALDHAALSSDRLGKLEQAHNYFQRTFTLDRTNEWALKEMLRIRSLLPQAGDSIVRISIARPK